MPRYLTNKNVFEDAEARMDWVYSEFPKVVVATSGGKDSTVVLNMLDQGMSDAEVCNELGMEHGKGSAVV